MEFEEVRVGTERVLTAKVPDSEKWVPALLNEIDNNQSKFETSHKINNRWENSYLDIDLVPTVRIPMRFARDLGGNGRDGEIRTHGLLLPKQAR